LIAEHIKVEVDRREFPPTKRCVEERLSDDYSRQAGDECAQFVVKHRWNYESLAWNERHVFV